MTWLHNAEDVPALGVAMRVPRLRILTGCCANHHAVVRVYQTAAGRIAFFQGLTAEADRSPAGPTPASIATLKSHGRDVSAYAGRPDLQLQLSQRSRGSHQGRHLAGMLDEIDAATESFTAECECRRTHVEVVTLLAALKRGVPRIVLE